MGCEIGRIRPTKVFERATSWPPSVKELWIGIGAG